MNEYKIRQKKSDFIPFLNVIHKDFKLNNMGAQIRLSVNHLIIEPWVKRHIYISKSCVERALANGQRQLVKRTLNAL